MTDGTSAVAGDSSSRRGRWIGALAGTVALLASVLATGSYSTVDRSGAGNPPPAGTGHDRSGSARKQSGPRGGSRAHTDSGKRSVGWDAFRDLDGLGKLRGGEQSREFSSFDRKGGNDDGFSGTYSCLRTTDRGCVIAERSGPGEISSMWFTRDPGGDVTATGTITVELDGKTVLDAPLSDVVNGRLGAPFVWPLVANADDTSGGAVIKVPMPYRQSMRVTVQNNPHFYHVNYRTFPDADGVQTFDPSDRADDVIDRLRRFGVADPKPPEPDTDVAHKDFDVAPGESVRLADVSGPAQINQLRLRLPQLVPSPQVIDDGRAFGAGGGSQFRARVAPNNQGVRITRRLDPQIADQVGNLTIDGEPAGQWHSGAAAPGQWASESIDVPASLTEDKSSVDVGNQFVSSSLDFNEFRYDVQSLVNGQWVRTDVLDLGPSHPGEEQAHDYQIDNQTFARQKLSARYPVNQDDLAASQDVLDNAHLRITFDGQTTVDAPIGEFFGSGLGHYDVRSLMSSIETLPDGWYTAWWPMPFHRRATVELVNGADTPIRGATGEVSSAPARVGADVGYFHATHHRGQATDGEDWNFLTAQGAGTFYGVTHTMRGLIPPERKPPAGEPKSRAGAGANQRNYLEGDERFYVNGSSSPAWYGTGTEDFYESGWYFRDGTTFAMPETGNPAYETNGDGCQYDCTGAYRLMLPDAVSFNDGLVAGIQHGPADDEPADYSSTAYWYGGIDPTQRESDTVDPTDDASRDDHNYDAQGETIGPLDSTFEGTEAPLRRNASTASGPISFEARIEDTNNGVRLRRLSDQNQPYQQAEVRVDGQPAGVWLEPLGNPYHRWLEDVFDLPPELTAGKSSVKIDLIPVGGAPGWSAASYTVLTR